VRKQPHATVYKLEGRLSSVSVRRINVTFSS
jgi:hypothetical protein